MLFPRGLSLFITKRESPIIRSVDVLITADAFLDIRTLVLLGPKPPAWGLLIGHKRGRRVFVERVFPAGPGAALPAPVRLEETDRTLGRRLVGLYAVRPSPAFKESVLGPYFYGRVFLDIRVAKNRSKLKPYVIEFDQSFFLAPVRLAARPKGGKS